MKVRRMRKKGTESVTSLDSSSWVSEGEGFGYPPKRFTDPNYPYICEEEEQKEYHPHDKNDDNAPLTTITAPREEEPTPNKINFELGSYCKGAIC